MKLLGLDIGSNSVGSAWVDTDKKLIRMGDSVFPAGIEESDTNAEHLRIRHEEGSGAREEASKDERVESIKYERFS